MREKMDKIYTAVVKFIGSKTFFWLIIAFFVLESLWIALSFRFPMLYDEATHFPLIKVFSHQFSPFVANQSHEYDILGDLSHQGSLFYHYIMSFPYRLISTFVENQHTQIVFLRSINIILMASGLVMFRYVFQNMKIKLAYANIAILTFVLLPIAPFIAATINYDNLLFFLTAIYLLICGKIIGDPHVSWKHCALLLMLGCLTALVKFTFLPIFVASFLYLIILLISRRGRKIIPDIIYSFKTTKKSSMLLLSGGLIISIGMFSLVYVQDIVRYGSPNPPCVKTMPAHRCLVNGNIVRNMEAARTKYERPLQPPISYASTWFSNMLLATNFSGATTTSGKVQTKSPLVVMKVILISGVFAGMGVLVYAWRLLDKNTSWYFLLSMVVVLIISVFLTNYSSYLKLHAAYAIQPRYLLSLLPIVLVMIVAAVGFILRNRPRLKLVSLAILVLLFTQGGGAITHIMLSDDNWYWKSNTVIKANHAAKKVLRPLIKGV